MGVHGQKKCVLEIFPTQLDDKANNNWYVGAAFMKKYFMLFQQAADKNKIVIAEKEATWNGAYNADDEYDLAYITATEGEVSLADKRTAGEKKAAGDVPAGPDAPANN